jgi:hypothetical protein
MLIPDPGTRERKVRSGPDIPANTCPTVEPVYPMFIPTTVAPEPVPPDVGPVIVITSDPVVIVIPPAPVSVLKISEDPDIPP